MRPLPQGKLEHLARVAKALADPRRIEMVRLLAQQLAPVCACDIVERFDLSQPTVSHHLKILREAGLIRRTQQGLWAFYELDQEGARMLGGLSDLVEPED